MLHVWPCAESQSKISGKGVAGEENGVSTNRGVETKKEKDSVRQEARSGFVVISRQHFFFFTSLSFYSIENIQWIYTLYEKQSRGYQETFVVIDFFK